MHWFREGNRQHSKILYVFRSPGGVRVGRQPLEPETLRQIEAEHPDIAFDWKVVRDNEQVVEAAYEPRRRRPPRQEESEAETPAPAPAPAKQAEVPAAPPRPTLPAKIEGDTPDAQIVFLTELYPIVRERIPQRTPDPARQDVLFTLAERLNPAAWTDADQITTGLQQAAEALERLAHVFARRRRRPRKKPRPTELAGGASATPVDAIAGGPDVLDDSDATESPDAEESPSH
jgi:hypothetical protein